MKRRLFITVMGASFMLCLGQVQAQNTNMQPPMPPSEHGGGGHMGMMTPEERLNRLAQELNLTDEQKTNVQGAFDQLRQSMGEAKTNLDTQLQNILTPEQYQKLQTIREHHRMWPPGPKGGWHHEGGEGETNSPSTNAPTQ